MDPRRLALGLALAVVMPALAGCAGDAPAAQGERVDKASTQQGGGSGGAPFATTPQAEAPRPRGTSERWHFHDYWKGNPNITILDTNVTFNVSIEVREDGAQVLSSIVTFPHGTIVPPETGFLTLNVSWEGAQGGLVNVTYRPADSSVFLPFADLAPGVPMVLPTTESNCDVPHRQESAWAFNLTAAPGGDPPGMPPREVRFTVHATIGRPLFIDPPHLDWWQGQDAIPIVAGASGEFAGASAPGANLTLGGAPPATSVQSAPHRVPVDEGLIVPEGSRSLVALLNWTSANPNAKLGLRYRENNLPSDGAFELAKDGSGARLFVLPVEPPQTDTTYSNRTSWEFLVLPDGAPAGAFQGTFTLTVWTTKLAPEEAMARFAPQGA